MRERERSKVAVLCALLGTGIVASCNGSPASPCTDQFGRGETALNQIQIACVPTATRLQCTAVASIGGLYVYCPKQQDVTTAAEWAVADTTIARVVAPGLLDRIAPGHTTVRAVWQGIDSETFGRVPIAVFPDTGPLRTYEITGLVTEAGKTPANGGISGAVAEVLDGLIAGSTGTTGVPPPLLPGYLGPFGGPNTFRILGVPPATYTVRVSKEGYIDQQRTVTVLNGSPNLDVQLTPR